MNQAKHGYYQCQALTDNVGPVSKITYVVVKGNNKDVVIAYPILD